MRKICDLPPLYKQAAIMEMKFQNRDDHTNEDLYIIEAFNWLNTGVGKFWSSVYFSSELPELPPQYRKRITYDNN